MRFLFVLFAAALVAGGPELPRKPLLTLDAARAVADAAEAAARSSGARVVIAVVDDGGHLLDLRRLDDTQPASVEVGVGKARTAAIFRRPSRVFEEQVRDGRVAALGLPGATPLQGGIPLFVEGRCVGAIGVSGETPQQDEAIALAGAAALERPPPPSRHLPASEVDAAFRVGAVLHDEPAFAVHASRRDAPGQAEVHLRETDVIHVLEGAATFVTGGALLAGTTVAPDELRGAAIEGGVERRLAKGDVVIVPKGVPHWFKAVDGSIVYHVVKVRS